MPDQQYPSIEPIKEVRFAVVMYGGVSLAIYINGVAQELFHLARATAPVAEDDKGNIAAIPGKGISNTERVYRKLAYLLADNDFLNDCRDYADNLNRLRRESENGAADPASRKALLQEKVKAARPDPLEQRTNEGSPVGTRFIVDILSGTSAGGINAIYLAKAFANNQPIDQLKDLWINEGDIGLLLNDKRSVAGTGLDNQSSPESLLNSRRMYAKLLKSLNDMEAKRPSLDHFKSPFVDELDLFITATDIEGVPVPLRLSDAVVYERRHRNVFHFKYGKAEVVGSDFNDFRGDLNPFLAFAARCTSSFPFAFEPMRLSDIDEVLNVFGGTQKAYQSDSQLWQRFFQEELDPKTGEAVQPPRFAHRSFGDGGYLDNKPFSYATETLIHRQSDVPVDRKLIYVEPSPEHPEDQPARLEKPNALQNVKAAILDLPTYETIREDLQRVLERNQLIERVNHIVSGIEADVNNYIPYAVETETLSKSASGNDSGGENVEAPPQNIRDQEMSSSTSRIWSDRDLADMVKDYGRYFLPYRRLRISSVTDDIAKLIARLTNFDENSDQFLAIRCLVRAWREANYVDYKQPGKLTVNRFLWNFDLGYRLRRLNFLRTKVDQLTRLDETLISELRNYSATLEKIRELKKIDDWESVAAKHPQIRLQIYGTQLLTFTQKPSDDFYAMLRFVKCELNEVFKQLRTRGRLLRSRSTQSQAPSDTTPANPLLKHIAKLAITPRDLNRLLGMSETNGTASTLSADHIQDEEDTFQRAQRFLAGRGAQTQKSLEATAAELSTQLGEAFAFAREKCNALFNVDKQVTPISEVGKGLIKDHPNLLNSEIATSIRGYLAYYHHNFDDYDQIRFPIFYETDVGEADFIEVIRISPEDAPSLINEREELRNSADPSKARQKLAGGALHHFGAFLDRVWRQNDIMWGRLDGAERLIASLLPGTQNKYIRQQLTEEAHLAILKDELKPESIADLQGVITESLLRVGTGMPINAAIEKALGPMEQSSQKRQLERIIRLSVNDDDLLQFMRKGYEVNRQLDQKAMLRSVSRATQIIGKMFEQLANDNGLEGKRLAWIARLGKLFWGLVEFAVPNSILQLLLFHWLKILYFIEVVLVFGSIFMGAKEVQNFGLKLFALTFAINLGVLVLRDYMQRKHRWQTILALFFAGFIMLLAVIGGIELYGIGVSGLLAKLNAFFAYF